MMVLTSTTEENSHTIHKALGQRTASGHSMPLERPDCESCRNKIQATELLKPNFMCSCIFCLDIILFFPHQKPPFIHISPPRITSPSASSVNLPPILFNYLFMPGPPSMLPWVLGVKKEYLEKKSTDCD